MKSWMNGVLVVTTGLCLAGCPEESTSTSAETSSTGKSKGSAEPSSSTTSKPAPTGTGTAAAGKPAIVPKAKAELHEKEPDSDHSGSSLSVKDAKSAFIVPAAWKSSAADDINKAIPDDGKARFGATGYADGDDTGKKADAVAKALELTDCSWGSDEDISLGKEKVATKVADGVCMRGKTVERVIRAVVAGDDAKIVAIGAWDDKADDKGVLNSFRSLAEAKSVAACCSALTQNAISAPPQQKLVYAAAIAVCQGLTKSAEGRQALAQVRTALPGVPIPAACQ